jgi:hypothetical protein
MNITQHGDIIILVGYTLLFILDLALTIYKIKKDK